jgi:hypothetical protein
MEDHAKETSPPTSRRTASDGARRTRYANQRTRGASWKRADRSAACPPPTARFRRAVGTDSSRSRAAPTARTGCKSSCTGRTQRTILPAAAAPEDGYPVYQQHGRLYGAGAEPVQGLLAGLMRVAALVQERAQAPSAALAPKSATSGKACPARPPDWETIKPSLRRRREWAASNFLDSTPPGMVGAAFLPARVTSRNNVVSGGLS